MKTFRIDIKTNPPWLFGEPGIGVMAVYDDRECGGASYYGFLSGETIIGTIKGLLECIKDDIIRTKQPMFSDEEF